MSAKWLIVFLVVLFTAPLWLWAFMWGVVIVLPSPPGCLDGPCMWTGDQIGDALIRNAPVYAPFLAAIAVVAVGIVILRRLRRR
jgi:hypothetical protein